MALTAGAAVLALSGCGGSAPTRQDVIARGNAICSSTLRAIRAVAPPAGGGSLLQDLSVYLQHVLPIIDKEVTGTRGLPRPAPHRAVLDRYVAAVAAAGSSYAALATAAREGNRGAVSAALARLRASRAQSFAAQYGLKACAAAAATVR